MVKLPKNHKPKDKKMNIEEIRRNTFIANLSGIAEHFNGQEIKC